MNGKRLRSLDALRGFDMFWIMGLSGAVAGFCKLFPGGENSFLFHQMYHVEWEGLAFHDTIFPLFLFIAGASFPFSYASQVTKGASRLTIHLRILKRLVLLVLLGMVYNGFLLNGPEDFRYASVLGKIGVAWAIAAVWYANFGLKTRFGILLATLAGYWTLLQFTAPDAPAGCGSFSLEGCLPGYLDRLGFTPGRLYCGKWLEPSGLPVSALGSSATAILGMFAGDLVRSAREGLTPARKSAALALVGAVLAVLGLVLVPTCPIVKKLWTPTFTLVCAGESFLLFALFHWIIDVKGLVKWSFPFQVVGANAIIAYMMQSLVNFRDPSRFLFGALAKLFPSPDFVIMSGYTLICWLILWYLYRKGTFLRV